MPSKRKHHDLEDFDHNKSDPDDDNFDPSETAPRRSSKKARPSRGSAKPSRRRRRGYRGSDIDDDEDDLVSDSDEGSFADDSDDEEEDEEAPLNAAGRKARKAATTRQNYAESSGDDAEGVSAPSESGNEAAKEPGEPSPSKMVTMKITNTSAFAKVTRRLTRGHTAEADDFVELSTSGRHAVRSRDSKSRSPESEARNTRSSRALKGLKKAPDTITEATQESSGRHLDDADEPDELSQDMDPSPKPENDDQDMAEVSGMNKSGSLQEEPEAQEDVKDAPLLQDKQNNGDEDDEDDVPITRRTRATRAAAAATATSAAEDTTDDIEGGRRSRRLTSRAGMKKKSFKEPSSDFDPGEDTEEDHMSISGKSRGGREDDIESPTPHNRRRKRRGRSGRSSRVSDASGDEEPELDADELNEEARELRQSSRPRRRREEAPIAYQETSRRNRKSVNYYMPPLASVNIDEEDLEEPAVTPARGRGRRGGASAIWERNLNTTFGPFGGGGGAGSLLNGPWGTGAAGGVDSDSSDDEMMHRSNAAGNVGMTPTSGGAAGGLVPGAPGAGMDSLATPNVGKIKDRKALADADPLGVDVNVDFSKVGGLQGHIDQLKEMVQLPLLYPELFSRFHVTPPRGVLFHGPPGTGKTLLARALANSVGSGGRKISFYMRKGADALSKWVGEAEKQLRLLFEEARRTQPSIIFFDEIDGLAPVRSSKQEQIHASIVSTLLALMDGMDGRGQVIVIGATNRPDNIDPALRRPGRFDREFYFPLPDIDGRKSILNIHTQDWGLSEKFQHHLAENTKGYGGADLRALCTEAALNAIQRTYPQIYSTQEKLVVDPAKINVHASDFMISVKKLIPSSERSATSGAHPLPESIQPLLKKQLDEAKRILDNLLPRKKKLTALEEAMFEQPDDEDHGFGRERLYQDFERARVFRPRLLIHGEQGMGQGYLSSAILHYFEGVHVQNFDLPALLGDGRPMDQVIVGLFTEIRRHKPSVIYIPNIDAWYAMLESSLALTTFKTMLKSIPSTDPVLLLATAEFDRADLSSALVRDLFGISKRNLLEVQKPEATNRTEYFTKTLQHISLTPSQFPDPSNRKKRVLEELPVAPTEQAKPPGKAEMKILQKRDHQLLNGLKVQLQPIMDQINRKYKKFRQPVIPQAAIDYLFAESDPNYVRADVEGGRPRPFEIVKDKHDNDVLRDTATGKTYYNLETTTIEERLSNGFYARPKDFVFDIKALARDAKNIGDKERTLKANELLSNVEVDVANIEANTAAADWEGLYRRQVQRAKDAAEKQRKRKMMQTLVDRVQSDVAAGNDSDSQGPVVLGEPVPGRTTARFQLYSPLSNGHGQSGQDSTSLSNGASHPPEKGDVAMADADETQAISDYSIMGPPPSQKATGGLGATQISQKSAVTSLPAGVSPSAVINEASTTKSSDPSTHRSSNWSNEVATNGNTEDQNSGEHRHNTQTMPDTYPVNHQHNFGEEPWIHSQVRPQSSQQAHAPPVNESISSSPAQGPEVSAPKALRNILNESPQSDEQHIRQSGSSGSQLTQMNLTVESFLHDVVVRTGGCTIEQLEQINREMMDVIWQTRHEWNRNRVLGLVTTVYNETIGDIENTQAMGPLSQD